MVHRARGGGLPSERTRERLYDAARARGMVSPAVARQNWNNPWYWSGIIASMTAGVAGWTYNRFLRRDPHPGLLYTGTPGRFIAM